MSVTLDDMAVQIREDQEADQHRLATLAPEAAAIGVPGLN